MRQLDMREAGQREPRVDQQRTIPTYQKGDYLKIALLPALGNGKSSVWICVDHCDEEHAIVFGVLESEPPAEFGKTLRRGTKLAASFWVVQEHQTAGN